MRDEKGLSGYGIKGLRPYYAPNPLRGGASKGALKGRGADAGVKGLRKNLLTPRAPRTRRMFRHYAECRNVETGFMSTEKIFQNVVWVAVVMVLMLGLEVTGWADEDDDEKAEMRDFVAAVYRGQGQYNMAGSIATGEGGVIMKRGSVWLTPRGQYQKVGSVYLTPDGGVVTRAGSTFIDEDEVIVKAGSTYTGSGQTTTTAGSVVLKPRSTR